MENTRNHLKNHGKSASNDTSHAIPIPLWVVIIVSLIIPFMTDYFLRENTPLAIYLLLLVPIVIYVFYYSLKKMLIWTLIISLLHWTWGIIYQLLLGKFIVLRIYNHLGFTIVSFAFALLLGKLLKELKEIEYRYRQVVENSPQFVVIHQKGKLIYANPTALQLSGLTEASQLLGRSIFDFVHPTSKEKALLRNKKVLEDKRANEFIEYKMMNVHGDIRYLELLGTKIFYNGQPAVMVIGKDVTANKEYQKKIEFMAYHDTLTGLPNRYFFSTYLDNALAICRKQHKHLAIMFLDLDRFKLVNDTMGHEIGDELLIQVGKRLVSQVRNEDVVARQGGDEFIILLEDAELGEVQKSAERILDSFTEPFILIEEEYYTTPSIGISVYPKDGDDCQTLIKNADTAMYLAKNNGKNNYQFYTHENEDTLIRKNMLEHGLKKAMQNNEFSLNYQPKVDLKTGNVSGVEALLRWHHPVLGLIPPLEFIPIAEETGMIISLGNWVLKEACYQNSEWHKKGFDMSIAVNVSALQFENKQFVNYVEDTLIKSELKPEYLVLEITESVMQDIKHSSEIIKTLQRIGVKIAIDDFGTGYSSLSVLNKLSIDLVKIDKSFVCEMMTNESTGLMVRTMIEMGENLRFDLVAEGIETEHQATFLVENRCRYGQGYYYSPPLSAPELETLLRNWHG